MEPHPTPPHHGDHPHHGAPIHAGSHPTHPHHVKPIDSGYRVIVHIALWVIAGTVLVGLIAWWVLT